METVCLPLSVCLSVRLYQQKKLCRISITSFIRLIYKNLSSQIKFSENRSSAVRALERFAPIFHISCPTGVKFLKIYLHIRLLKICESHENLCPKRCTWLTTPTLGGAAHYNIRLNVKLAGHTKSDIKIIESRISQVWRRAIWYFSAHVSCEYAGSIIRA